MKIVKWLAIILAVLIVLFVLVGLTLPKDYNVERSVVIQAEPAVIHTLVGDLNAWEQWTPWVEADPTIKTTFGDKTTGVGASQTWTGDSGSGRLTFTQCSPDTGVLYDMSFEEGKYVSIGALDYKVVGGGTEVTWRMAGEMGGNPISRYFAAMMDAMVGPMFEKGLDKLKSASEAIPPMEPELPVEEEPAA
jgi:hypothetical protein